MTQRYVYDSPNNRWNTFNLAYDPENRMVQVSGAVTETFKYNGDGQRIIATQGMTTTVYIGNYFEWHGTTSNTVKYYSSGGTRLAMRVGTNPPVYLMGDHLGSTSVAVDGNGALVGSPQLYKAWGETRAGSLPTKYQYTGQFRDSYINLYWYGSRWYDSYLNRWTSPDSIVPSASQGIQAYDRYAYTNNNPIRFNDPNGHDVGCAGQQASACGPIPLIAKKYAQLHSQVHAGKVADDLVALSQLTDFSASVTHGCTDCFVRSTGAVLTGLNTKYPAEMEAMHHIGLGGLSPYDPNYVQSHHDTLGQSGYDSSVQDPDPQTTGGNQAHHFWYYVQTGYDDGGLVSEISNSAHESTIQVGTLMGGPGASKQDYNLGEFGIQLGEMLRAGSISPEQVGEWILNNLSPRNWMGIYEG